MRASSSAPYCWNSSQIQRPCHCLLWCQRGFPQAVGNAGVALDLIDREVLVGAEPESADRHGVPRPGLELTAMAGAIEHQKAGWWEAHSAAPRQGQAPMRLLDKIVEIAVPAVIEIAEEQQAAAVVQECPMGKVDRAHA